MLPLRLVLLSSWGSWWISNFSSTCKSFRFWRKFCSEGSCVDWKASRNCFRSGFGGVWRTWKDSSFSQDSRKRVSSFWSAKLRNSNTCHEKTVMRSRVQKNQENLVNKQSCVQNLLQRNVNATLSLIQNTKKTTNSSFFASKIGFVETLASDGMWQLFLKWKVQTHLTSPLKRFALACRICNFLTRDALSTKIWHTTLLR